MVAESRRDHDPPMLDPDRSLSKVQTIEPPRPDRPEPLRVRRWTGRAVLIDPEASRSSPGRPRRSADRSAKAT